jgi:hypothetical protein
VHRPRQSKTNFTPYNITITIRNRNTCTIPVTTFFSSASQPRIGRGQNLTKIAKVRTDEELLMSILQPVHPVGHLSDRSDNFDPYEIFLNSKSLKQYLSEFDSSKCADQRHNFTSSNGAFFAEIWAGAVDELADSPNLAMV